MATAPRTFGVVGAGILGLAVAREVLRRYPGSGVTVFEKEDRVAAHQTGHNSGVVHAGIYYQPGSLKAELCKRGRRLLGEFCDEHGLENRELGKLIVASDPGELAGLAAVEDRAVRNEVPGLRRLDGAAMREIEPFVAGVAALYSPHTSVVDYPAVCAAMVKEIRGAGGEVLLRSPVTSVRESGSGVGIVAGSHRHVVDRLVACAGLSTDAVAKLAGIPGDVRIVPFRGEYYSVRPRAAHFVRGLIYPVPDPRYPFLGVHLTRDVSDGVHVGPNAVLALSLEGYRWRDVDVRDLAQIATWPGMHHLARQHWRRALSEVATSLSRRRFADQIARYVPDIGPDDLIRSAAGVRAQAVRRNGDLVDDFVIQRAGAVTVVRNAPSPAATSSFAIAEHILSDGA